MANFWDLPKDVRERIYRMHLVSAAPVKYNAFKAFCGCSDTNDFGNQLIKVVRTMPRLLQVSEKLENEASEIYFGENTLLVDGHNGMLKWSLRLWSRHVRLIRSVVLTEWAPYQMHTGKRYLVDDFRRLASLPQLRSLVIRIDEKKTLNALVLEHNSSFVGHWSLGAGFQMYLQMLRVEGMAGLRSLRNLRHVKFPRPGSRGKKRGSIRGGLLETMVKREIMQPSGAQEQSPDRQGHFRFADLPPELRNTVYAMLLEFSGTMFPRDGDPTSITSLHYRKRASVPVPRSALSILLVNHQTNKEAYGLFYSHNDLAFATPIRLQAFILSLGHDRLDCLRSLTFFYKKGATSDGLSFMDTILSTLRLLRGLRKLHILIPWSSFYSRTPEGAFSVLQESEANPARLSGAKTLFTFRKLNDIKVLGPTTVTEYAKAAPYVVTAVKRSDAIFRHFNYGLRLAQKGRIFHELYSDTNWVNEEAWPALGTQTSLPTSDFPSLVLNTSTPHAVSLFTTPLSKTSHPTTSLSMANFMDLPKAVREKIYRLHLVADEHPVTFDDYKDTCGYTETLGDAEATPLASAGHTFRGYCLGTFQKPDQRKMPALLHVNRKIEGEAARIYFGENTFCITGPGSLYFWAFFVWPRHLRLIRKLVILKWTWHEGTAGNDAFMRLNTLSQLKVLTVKMDELSWLTSNFKWHRSLGFGPQVAIQSLRIRGITGLRSLRGLREVNFVKKVSIESDSDGAANLGAIPGGFLEKTVKHEMIQPRSWWPDTKQYNEPFRFLDLPPELRTNIYKMLLAFPGPTYPVAGQPVSVTSRLKYMRRDKRESLTGPGSVLNILCVNRQVHDEARLIFYQENHFVLSTPAKLEAFTLSLGNDGLNALQSVSLFYGEHKEDHVVNMELTLLPLRFLRGLRKFHLLLPYGRYGPGRHHNDVESLVQRPSDIGGAQALFAFRNLDDIRVRHLLSEDRQQSTSRKRSIFRHFNRGLQLAQSGKVVSELYTNESWSSEDKWPVLEGSDCGRRKGCSCRLVGDPEAMDYEVTLDSLMD